MAALDNTELRDSIEVISNKRTAVIKQTDVRLVALFPIPSRPVCVGYDVCCIIESILCASKRRRDLANHTRDKARSG